MGGTALDGRAGENGMDITNDLSLYGFGCLMPIHACAKPLMGVRLHDGSLNSSKTFNVIRLVRRT